MASLNHYYAVLNLEPGSTQEDIKRAYRKLAQQWHPDKFSHRPDQLKQAREKFERIKEAYDRLIHFSCTDDLQTIGPRISVKPISAEDYYEEGLAYLRVVQHQQAIKSFSKAIRKRSNYLQAYQARAFTLEQIGSHRQAEADFRKVAELKRSTQAPPPDQPTNPLTEADIIFQQGLVQFRARKYGAAINSFTTVIGINPNHIDAYRYRSQAYFRRGYDQRADADFKRMRELEQQAAPTDSRAASYQAQSASRWQCIHTLVRHTAPVSAVAMTRDGKKLITGSYDATLRIWHIKTGSLLKTLSDYTKAIHCVAVSADGKFVAAGGADHTIKIWEIRTGELLRSLGILFLGHSDTVTALAFSPNNQFLVSASVDKTVRLWSLKSGKALYTLKDSPDPILALAMSWDGKSMVYGGESNVLSMRHTKTGKPIRSFSIGGQPNRAVALSRQDSLLAAGSGSEIVVWNRHFQKKLFQLKGHSRAISALVFSADSQTLVSGSHDKIIRLWRASSGTPMDTLTGHEAAVYSVAYSLDGQIIASGDANNIVKIWQQV